MIGTKPALSICNFVYMEGQDLACLQEEECQASCDNLVKIEYDTIPQYSVINTISIGQNSNYSVAEQTIHNLCI
jgi:hypothetical protein